MKILLLSLGLGSVITVGLGQNVEDWAEVKVVFSGLRNQDGQLLYCVFDQETGFPDRPERALLTGAQPLRETANPVIVLKLQRGKKYAFSVVHDENMNGKMDTNFFGIPSEGYGFSQNAKGFMSAPGFKACSFGAEAGGGLEVRVRY